MTLPKINIHTSLCMLHVKQHMLIFYRLLIAAIRFTAGSLTKYRIVRMDLNGSNEFVVKNYMVYSPNCIAADVTGEI